MEDFFLPCCDNPQNTPERRTSLALVYAVLALGIVASYFPPLSIMHLIRILIRNYLTAIPQEAFLVHLDQTLLVDI
jgi:hypothetical protein